jgi:hypothetical protein
MQRVRQERVRVEESGVGIERDSCVLQHLLQASGLERVEHLGRATDVLSGDDT